ncbi:MAG: hypothetical protein OXF79_08860 [Chloroflexi bacterium]|nr:hypothetical protein [Chloroflexota bacterium]
MVISNEVFAEILGFLTVWLILATIIEESIGLLFNWRIFKSFSEGKGYKTPIVFFVSLAFCYAYGIDLIYEILRITQMADVSKGSYFIGYIITAAFLAGGSGTVYKTIEKVRKTRSQSDTQP